MSEVFISYAHEDHDWVDRLRRMLTPLMRQGQVTVWDDRRIKPGEQWREKIDTALQDSQVAVLLISDHYLASEFISTYELPYILDSARRHKVTLLWVHVRRALWNRTELEGYQAAYPPEPPIEHLDQPRQQDALAEIARRIHAASNTTISNCKREHDLSRNVWNIPLHENPAFTGREDLLESIHASFKEGRTRAELTQAIHGLGGVGKTQLVLRYAYTYRGEYDLVWWINCEKTEILAADYAALADELRLPGRGAENQKRTIQAVREWLESHDRWLLVFDNANEPADLNDYLPRFGCGHIIMTSRYHNWRNLGRSVQLVTWTPAEAVRFVIRQTGQENEQGAAQLARELGYLPLALAHAAAYIDNTPGLSITDYLDGFRQVGLQLLSDPELLGPSVATVSITWKLSLDALQHSSPESVDLFRLCAFLAPEELPYGAMSSTCDVLPKPLGPQFDPTLWDRAWRKLNLYSLVDPTRSGVKIHRLVQLAVGETMTVAEREHWITVAVTWANRMFPPGEGHPYDLSLTRILLPHALIAAEHAAKNTIGLDQAAALLSKVGRYQADQLSHEDAESNLSRAISLYKRIKGSDASELAEPYGNFGWLHFLAGRYAASHKYFEQAVILAAGDSKSERLHRASVFTAYSYLLREEGSLTEAEEILMEALEIRKNFEGEQSHEAMASRYALAELSVRQADNERARDFSQQVLAFRRATLSEDHPLIAEALDTLGVALHQLGSSEEALVSHREAIRIRARQLGPLHIHTATSKYNLAVVLEALGNMDEAEQHYREANTIIAATNIAHPDLVILLSKFALFLKKHNRHDEAEFLSAQSLEIARKLSAESGGLRRFVATTVNHATLLHQLKQLEQAKRFALALLDQATSLQALEIVNVLLLLSSISKDQQQFEEATEYQFRALKAVDDSELKDVPQIRRSIIVAIANLNIEIGNDNEAMKFLQQLLEIHLGDPRSAGEPPNDILGAIVTIYHKQGRLPEALDLYECVIESQPEHKVPLALSLANVLLSTAKNYDLAEEWYRKALVICPEDNDLSNAYAMFLKNVRHEYRQAERLYREILCREPDHAVVTANLALLLASTFRQYSEAEKLYKKSLNLDPSNHTTWSNYAFFLHQARLKFEDAREAYEQALSHNSNDPNIYINRSTLLLTIERYQEARQDQARALILSGSAVDRVVAKAFVLQIIIDMLEHRDFMPALGYLKAVFQVGFIAAPWAIDSLLEYLPSRLNEESFRLVSSLAGAVSDIRLVQDLEGFPEWSLDTPAIGETWEDVLATSQDSTKSPAM